MTIEARVIISCRQVSSPGQPAIGGSTQLNQVGLPFIVPFNITMTVVRAGRGHITGDPVFVEILTRIVDDGHGITPRGSTVGRKTHQDRNAIVADKSIGGNHPCVMSRVIGD